MRFPYTLRIRGNIVVYSVVVILLERRTQVRNLGVAYIQSSMLPVM